MDNQHHAEQGLEDQLDRIDRHLQDIQKDVADILRNVQDELDTLRERELWRQYDEYLRKE